MVHEKPPEPKLLILDAGGEQPISRRLFFTIKDEQVSDYHYYLYDELAALLSHRLPGEGAGHLARLLREELSGEVHGEVDEKSWHLKQTLLRRPMARGRTANRFGHMRGNRLKTR